MSEEIKFIEGFWANKPREKAPDFIKSEISIDLSRFVEWAREWKKSNPDEKYLKITVKESKKNEFYAQLNEWKPENKPAAASQSPVDRMAEGFDDLESEDIPF